MEATITLVITMDSVGMYIIAGLNIKANIKFHMYPIRIEAKTPMEATITPVITVDSVGMYIIAGLNIKANIKYHIIIIIIFI